MFTQDWVLTILLLYKSIHALNYMWDMSYVNSLCKLWLPLPSNFYVTLF